MIRFLASFLFFMTILFAENEINNNENNDVQTAADLEAIKTLPNVDCLILQDENSIICKFEAVRSTQDQEIIVQWIDPQGDISRSRNMIVPAGHGSIYDYRYIKGRILGDWIFKVILDEKEYVTQFELK